MKKFFSILGLILTFLMIYFLQANFFTWFNIAGIKPNLFIVFILFIGLFIGNKLGFAFGLILGIFLDLLIGKSVGISGIMLAIVGLIGEYLDNNFSKDSRVTLILMVMGSTAVYELGTYLFQILRWNISIYILTFIRRVFIEVIFY